MDELQNDDKFAELLASLDDELAGCALGSDVSSTLRDASPQLHSRLVNARECLWLLESAWPRPRPLVGAVPESIGRFKVLRQIGFGGFGTVFLADDPELNRRVAIKIPHAIWVLSKDAHRRFLREAGTTARLSHPNIVAVYEVGEIGVVPFIATEFCDGPTLSEWLAKQEGPTAIEDAVNFVIDLAAAMHYAHSRGVLHRDLKPSNILLCHIADAASAGRSSPLCDFSPKISDFGLAKVLDVNDDPTLTGAILGTLAYLAPEQAEGRVSDISVRTDVYALGLIFYELLAGRRLHPGGTDAETLQSLSEVGPVPASGFPRHTPKDLVAICQKCLEQEPAKRYASAEQLAEDLTRYCGGLPIAARPIRIRRRVWMWARRRPALASLAVVSVVALVTLAVAGAAYNSRLNTALTRLESEAHANHALLYSSNVRVAADAWAANGAAEAIDALADVRPADGQSDLREFTWHYLWNLTHSESCELRGHVGDVHQIEFSPDGQYLASAGRDKTARLWDVASASSIREFAGHTGEVNAVAFTGTNELATASDDGSVAIWNSDTGERQAVLEAGEGPVFALATNPTRHILATGGLGQKIHLWDLDSRTLLWSGDGKAVVESLTFSPDCKILISGHRDGTVRWWNVDRGIELQAEKPFNDWAVGVAHSPDLPVIAFGGRTGELVTYRRTKTQWQRRLSTEVDSKAASIYAMAFSPRDNTLATGTRDGLIALWNVGPQLSHTRDLPGHRGRVWDVAWSPDGQLLASASSDGTVKVWDIEHAARRRRAYPTLSSECVSIQVSPDSRQLVTGTADGRIYLWDRAHRQGRCLSNDQSPGFSGGCFTDDGKAMITTGPKGGLREIDLEDLKGKTLSQPEPTLPCSMSIAPCAGILAVGCEHGAASLFNVKDGTLRFELKTAALDVLCIAITADGSRLATAGAGNSIQLWDGTSGKLVDTLFGHDHRVFSLLFAPDGQTLFSGGNDFTVCVWDVPSGQLRGRLVGQTAATTTLAISPDGRTLASGSHQPTMVRTWDSATLQQLRTFHVGTENVNTIAFTPDNAAIVAACGNDGSGQVVEWTTVEPSMKVAHEPLLKLSIRPDIAGQSVAAQLAADFADPDVHCLEIIQAVHDYALRSGYAMGYPTFRIEPRNDAPIVEAVLVQSQTNLKKVLVTLNELDDLHLPPRLDYRTQSELVEDISTKLFQWGRTKGYLAAVPTFYGSTTLNEPASFEAYLISGLPFQRWVVDLDESDDARSVASVFRQVHALAVKKGFLSAVSTFRWSARGLECIAIRKDAAMLAELSFQELNLERHP